MLCISKLPWGSLLIPLKRQVSRIRNKNATAWGLQFERTVTDLNYPNPRCFIFLVLRAVERPENPLGQVIFFSFFEGGGHSLPPVIIG